MKTLKLTITSVSQTFFNGEAQAVTVPGVLGEMQILANHEAIISNLEAGKIIIKNLDGEKEIVEIQSGILEHSHNQTIILISSPDPTAKPK